MIERVYLIRHGQTDWNVEGRWQGFEAVPLNEVGWMQARALGEYLRRPISAIYTSDLTRAFQTAQALGEALQLTPHPDPRLREFNLGIFQGLTFAEIKAQYPEEAEAMLADYMGYPVPNGETRYQLQARAYEAFEDIVAADPGKEVAIVSHGGTIKVLLMKLLGDLPEIQAAHFENTSITTIERKDGGWRVVEFGATPHLSLAVSDSDIH